MLLWASKCARAKIERSFEMRKLSPLRATFNLLAMHMVHLFDAILKVISLS